MIEVSLCIVLRIREKHFSILAQYQPLCEQIQSWQVKKNMLNALHLVLVKDLQNSLRQVEISVYHKENNNENLLMSLVRT